MAVDLVAVDEMAVNLVAVDEMGVHDEPYGVLAVDVSAADDGPFGGPAVLVTILDERTPVHNPSRRQVSAPRLPRYLRTGEGRHCSVRSRNP